MMETQKEVLMMVLLIFLTAFLAIFIWCVMKCISWEHSGNRPSVLYIVSSIVAACGSVTTCVALLAI